VPAPIIAGAEPYSSQGGPGGVLVVHGFTGNPQSMRPLAMSLAGAGFSVELPLLPGHGTSIDDLVPTRWSDYSAAVESSYALLASKCDAVAVVGLSVGGTLACWLAERHPEIRGLVLVNPFVEPPAEEYRAVIASVLESGTELAPGVGSDIAKEGSVELAYEHTPLRAALSLFDGIDEVSERLGAIECPVLLISSRQDHVVPTSSGDHFVERVSAPVERVWLERSYHVATLDYDAEQIEALTLAFVRGRLGEQSEGQATAKGATSAPSSGGD
jgi:carboxylesterase